MSNKVRFLGRVASKSVKGLPPGIHREVLTSDVTDRDGHTWPTGTEYVAQAGGYSNPDGCSYVDAVIVA